MSALIGQLSSALWLAEYLKRETEKLHPLPYVTLFVKTQLKSIYFVICCFLQK